MYAGKDRLANSRSKVDDYQSAVRRRLMKNNAPLMKPTYGGNKKVTPQKEKN